MHRQDLPIQHTARELPVHTDQPADAPAPIALTIELHRHFFDIFPLQFHFPTDYL